MPTKTTGKGLQRVTSRVWYLTDPDKPRPWEHAAKGARPCCAALEKRKRKTRDARKNLFIWIAILSSKDSNGFSSFKIIKATVLNTVTVSPCSASLSLSLSLSLSHSDHQISSNKLFQLYTYFHTAMRSIINGHACGCCAVLKENATVFPYSNMFFPQLRRVDMYLSRLTPVSHRKCEQRRSVAYAEREQRASIVLSYWQRLSRAAEPRLVG